MMKINFLPFVAVAGVTLFAGSAAADTKQDPKGIAFFEKKIRPVLISHCYRCHSQDSKKSRGGLMLDTRQGMRTGGDTGHGIVPGDLKASLIMQAILYKDVDLQMPPNKKLPDSVIADFRRWVEMGAPDPRDGKTKKAYTTATVADLWSLQPVKKPEIPKVKKVDWPTCDIDHFILKGLEQKGLQPVNDANPLALLRRVHFDLTGLPPKVEDQEAFLKDHSKEAFERVVDRLLASPQFGERWGRHWLDVARYAESNGKDRDVLFPHAWRYRNYVIDAFNEDVPFDRFITEQVAGDLLPAKNSKEKTKQIIATGFLALGPKGSGNSKEDQMDLIDDQIDTTCRAFLGMTAGCARCHDHKFDPIPTKDYYSMAGIFASTKTHYNGRKNGVKGLLPIGENAKKLQKENAEYRKKVAGLGKQIKSASKRIRKFQRGKNKTALQKAQQQLKKLQSDLKEIRKNPPPPLQYAMAVQDSRPQNLKVLIRGDVKKQGEPAPRGFLTAVEVAEPLEIDSSASGRLEMAKWLTHPSNPLTARVAVNRIWHHLFGQGLVRTVDNFGSNGEKPSHPELLDHLALKFMSDGWSTKKLIRSIVLSRTYQLAAAYNEKNYQVDPANRLLWRRSLRRLDVEAIRDSLLAASGKLDLKRPERSIVSRIGYGEVGRGINTKPLEEPFPHRTVYMAVLRTDLAEIFKLFDFAEPSLVVGNRSITTLPSQALFLMNSPFVIDNAKAMSKRLLNITDISTADRIRHSYQMALGRLPSDGEHQKALNFISRFDQGLQKRYPKEADRQSVIWTSYCQALFASAEFRYQN